MLVTQNRHFKKQYVIGGAGIFDSVLKFLIRTFTSQAAKQVASSAAKELRKTALDVGKTMAVNTGKKLIERAMKPKTGNKIWRRYCYSRISEKTKRIGIEIRIK